MKVKLNKIEAEYLLSRKFISKIILEDLKSVYLKENQSNKYIMEISDDEADEIRDLCCEELDLHGFNIDDSPNEVGLILESLIDKFFIG